jgi:serine/threonine protein kinase
MPLADGILAPGTVLAGKLRIVRMIGEGGMATVYEVEHELTKHRRALKILHSELSLTPDAMSRFLREASAAARIENPHIAETFDAGTLETGEPYIVMELLEGRTLADLIAQQGRLDFAEALRIVRQACEAIQSAHDAGIVHRDLKPDNLFLVAGERTFVKVLDFGISKFDSSRSAGNHLTQDSMTLGTPYYMSPEQIRSAAHVDGRTDIYSLGVVLYECLTGSKPFVADTIPAIAVVIHEGKYEPLRRARPDAPPELELMLARALHVDRDCRYPTPAAFAQALSTVVLARSGSEATRTLVVAPAATHRSQTLSRQRRLPKALGLAAVVFAIVVALVFKNRASDGGNATHADVQVPASALPLRRVEVDRPTRPPQVSPAVRQPEAVSSGSPSAAAGGKTTGPARERTPPATSEKPAQPSRARQHGLAEENPFR